MCSLSGDLTHSSSGTGGGGTTSSLSVVGVAVPELGAGVGIDEEEDDEADGIGGGAMSADADDPPVCWIITGSSSSDAGCMADPPGALECCAGLASPCFFPGKPGTNFNFSSNSGTFPSREHPCHFTSSGQTMRSCAASFTKKGSSPGIWM